MYKTIAFIVATLLVAHAIAPITDCVAESTDAKCILCKFGMVANSGRTACAAPTADECTVTSLGMVNGINICEVCPYGKKPTMGGTCITSAVTAGPDASCGLAYIKTGGAAWQCLGCAASVVSTAASLATLAADSDKCTTAAYGSSDLTAMLILGTVKTCPVDIKLGDDTLCTNYKTNLARHAVTTPTPVPTHIQVWDSDAKTGDTEVKESYYYSATNAVKDDGSGFVAAAGEVNADCWITNTAGTTCLKCRWSKVSTFIPLATGGKVTCAAAETATAIISKCIVKYIPTVGGAATDAKCQTCSYLNGTLAAVNSTFFCPDGAVAGGNNSSNNTSNPTTSSSILSLSFAAFLILIINRLF